MERIKQMAADAFEEEYKGNHFVEEEGPFLVGFEKGYTARDAEECEWRLVPETHNRWAHHKTACHKKHIYRANRMTGKPLFTCCPDCGRKVKVVP